VATTPAEWLPILTKRLDDRAPRVTRLRDYTNGRAPLPEMGKNTRASWVAFQKKARTDFGGLCVGSLGDRIQSNGLSVGDAESVESDQARRIWRDNRMDVQLADVVDDYLSTGVGYLVLGAGAGGAAVITREEPELFYAAPDPLRPMRSRAAVKVWRDLDAGVDFALVWAPGQRQRFARQSATGEGVLIRRAQGEWKPAGDVEEYDGDVPVVILERAAGQGLIEKHTDTIDRINLGKLQRLVTTAMQAYRQRAIKGDLPEKDEAGNTIDWAKTFEPAPGALWDLPEGIDIWESSPTDIRPLLDGETQDARDFAAVTRTPISVFVPDGANQSAEGAANATAGQVAQAWNEINRIEPGLEVVLVLALRIEGVDLPPEVTVDVSFQNPAYVSLSEKYAAAAQAKAAGVPVKTIMRDILGYSPEQIARADQERAEEQLNAAVLVAAATPAPAPVVTGGDA
jgi:hypothetical protein